MAGDRIEFTGKGNRPRRVYPAPAVREMLERWRRQYERQVPATPDAPVIVAVSQLRTGQGRARFELDWGTPLTTTRAVRNIIHKRATLAGLDPTIATHDLRRTLANLMHQARSANGGHLFDLLDIQQELGHASPDTTQRCYVSQISTDVLVGAGELVD